MAEEFRDKSVLFITPCFLSRRLHKSIRGVEVFDLKFVRQLAELGLRLTVPADKSWKRRFETHLDGVDFEPLYVPSLRKPLWNTLAAAYAIGSRRFDGLILGNPARGMAPGLKRLHKRGCFDRAALLAHRAVRDAFYKDVEPMGITWVAVNDAIADGLETLSGARPDVYYGIPNARDFNPPEPSRESDGAVRFCLLGNLDDPCKGTNVAIDAFMALPEDLRNRAELHLAAFQAPPKTPNDRIIAYEWLQATEIPAFLQRMDAMLVPSTMETFSQAIVQGMLTALPVIASDVPALVEKLDTGGGYVCRSTAEYTDAMRTLIEDDTKRRAMGAIALKTARERYAWDTAHFVRTWLFTSETPQTASETVMSVAL